MFQVVQGTENTVELNYLNSLTEYQVAVFAIYRSSASEALRGSATTCKLREKAGLMLTLPACCTGPGSLRLHTCPVYHDKIRS